MIIWDRSESIILRHLATDLSYSKQVLPDMKPELFLDRKERAIFSAIKAYIDTYESLPTMETMARSLDRSKLQKDDIDDANGIVNTLLTTSHTPQNGEWLLAETESFIKDKSIHNATLELIGVMTEGKKSKKSVSQCLEEIEAANVFTFSFNASTGLGLDWECLYEHLQSPDEKFPFDVDILNEMTCGGPRRKTLAVIQAPTNTGKTLILCHMAAAYLRQGRNVVYITLEMADKLILQRIYANLLQADMSMIETWTTQDWSDAVAKLPHLGKLKIREYDGGTAHVGHFKSYLEEVKRKDRFTPDAIMVDHINECASQRVKHGGNIGLYEYTGSVTSELRSLAANRNAVVWTATQTNRDGYEGDPSLKNTANSAETNAKSDLMIGVQRDDNAPDCLRFSVIKNRNELQKGQIFMVGVNRPQMRLYDPANPVVQVAIAQTKLNQLQKRKGTKPSFLK